MEERDEMKIIEEVNPLFTTAEICLRVLAETGDKDAQLLLKRLDFDAEGSRTEKDELTNIEKFHRMKAIPGFTTTVEARFTASSNLIRGSGAAEVVDLPCGYTPRGLKSYGENIPYFGLDVPAVIRRVGPVCRDIIAPQTGNIVYREADATNCDSIRRALEGVNGELFITSEGLLMYLSQSELEEVFRNMRRLLEKYGGVWVTTDNMIASVQEKLRKVIAPEKGNTAAPAGAMKVENIFFDMEKAETFVSDMGFSLKKIPVYDYLPETLATLSCLPEDIQEQAKLVFREMYFWVMRARPAAQREFEDKEKQFSIKLRRKGKELRAVLSGRLDTMTSPHLLKLYREENEKEPALNVRIDMRDLDYISSAGLRVLLFMIRERPKEGKVILCGVKSDVDLILKTSGFDRNHSPRKQRTVENLWEITEIKKFFHNFSREILT